MKQVRIQIYSANTNINIIEFCLSKLLFNLLFTVCCMFTIILVVLYHFFRKNLTNIQSFNLFLIKLFLLVFNKVSKNVFRFLYQNRGYHRFGKLKLVRLYYQSQMCVQPVSINIVTFYKTVCPNQLRKSCQIMCSYSDAKCKLCFSMEICCSD
jgi:hypothetical protein